MRLINQIIEKKLMKYQENIINDNYNFWDFYCAYNLAKVVLEKKTDGEAKKNALYKKILLGINVEQSIVEMRQIVDKDMNMVMEFQTHSESAINKEFFFQAMYEPKKGIIGILDFEVS